MPPQNSCPVQRVQTYLALRAYMSIQSSGLTMSNEDQAKRMLTATVNPAGGYEYTGEYYEACRCFLAGSDPSMPEKTLIHPNEMNIDRLLKVTGTHSKIHSGDSLLAKAKRDRAELANNYMPLLVKVVPSYPNIGSGKGWDEIQTHFRLGMWQERCKILLADNVKDAVKSLKDAQGRLKAFDDHTNGNPPKNQQEEDAQAARMQEFRKEIEKLETKLSKVSALEDAGPPSMGPDWYPVEWIAWLHFGPSREFQYGPDSWLSPRNGMYASAGPDPTIHKSGAGKAARAAIPSRQDLRTMAMEALSPKSNNSSGTSTPSAADSADKLVATLKEANDIERERFETDKKRFENEKEIHDIKIAETKLKNVSAILRNPPASLSESQLKRMRAQEVFLTGIVTGVELDDDLEPAASAQKRKVGE